jgi:YebC/PmpR family DNA-binding regulatory protein
MSGHNKWAQIKRQKAVTDGKRSKIFSVLVKTISLEAKRAGGDRSAPGLRRAIEKAKENNMPNDNIERAIKNALGLGAATYEEVLYETYGPGGVAILIEGITDNRNRSSQELKHLLSQHGSSLAVPGSVTWAFQKTEEGWRPTSPTTPPSETQEALAALVEALENHEDVKKVISNLCAS